MARTPCCEKMGLKKGPWTPEEDQILISYIQRYGHGNWRALPKQAGLLRCGKSCRLRWINYLRPDIKRGKFSKEEEETILTLHQILGNRWSAIAARLPGRTDNEIKNFWHTHLKKRLERCGVVQNNVGASSYNVQTSSSSRALVPVPQAAVAEDAPSAADSGFNGKVLMNNATVEPGFHSVLSSAEPMGGTHGGSNSMISEEMEFWYNQFMNAEHPSQGHGTFGQFA